MYLMRWWKLQGEGVLGVRLEICLIVRGLGRKEVGEFIVQIILRRGTIHDIV